MSDLVEMQKSLMAIRKLNDENNGRSARVMKMIMVGHVDLRNVCELFDYTEKTHNDVVGVLTSLYTGIHHAVEMLNGGKGRGDLVKHLNNVLKQSGFDEIKK